MMKYQAENRFTMPILMGYLHKKAACKPNTQGLQAAYITLRLISMGGCPRLRALVASAHAPLCGLWLRLLARCLRCGLGWQ